MKDFLNTVFSAIAWVVILVLLFLVTSGIYQYFLSPKPYNGFLGIGYAVVVSGSMEPNIRINDLILYQDHARADYQVGDPIVYVRDAGTPDEMLITHRIVEINGNDLVTRGDANRISDSPITFDDVVGRVVFRVPYIGVAVGFVKTPAGMWVALGFVVLLIILNLTISLLQSKKRKHVVQTVMGEQIIRY